MSAEFTVWDRATGRILRTGSCSKEHVNKQARDGETVSLGYFPGESYYRDEYGFKTKREFALSRDGAFIRNLPIPCIVHVTGTRYVVDDGEIELSFEYPGEYKVRFEAKEYKDLTLTIQWPLSSMVEPLNQS